MRAFWRRFLAPVILATAATIAAAPVHQISLIDQSASSLTAHACPAGSNWDNILHRCV